MKTSAALAAVPGAASGFFIKPDDEPKSIKSPWENFDVVMVTDGPEAVLKCHHCRGDFWVDPCIEENLVLMWTGNGHELLPQCPYCKVHEVFGKPLLPDLWPEYFSTCFVRPVDQSLWLATDLLIGQLIEWADCVVMHGTQLPGERRYRQIAILRQHAEVLYRDRGSVEWPKMQRGQGSVYLVRDYWDEVTPERYIYWLSTSEPVGHGRILKDFPPSHTVCPNQVRLGCV